MNSHTHFLLSFFLVVTLLFELCAAIEVQRSKPTTGSPLLPSAFIMPWFCLGRCDNGTVADIESQVSQIEQINKDFASGVGHYKIEVVAFEKWNLGVDGTLDIHPSDNLFDLNLYLKTVKPNIGIKQRIAMVSSYPYPPQILNWTRALIANPQPFTDALIQQLLSEDIDGVNIDLEPTAEATEADALAYAGFLSGLNKALAEAPGRPRILSVAGANWSTFWNIPAIASALAANSATSTGYFTSMNTYTASQESFETQLAFNMASFGVNTPKANQFGTLVVGLEDDNSNPTSAQGHFQVLQKENLCQIAVWRMPLVPFYLPLLDAFGKRCF